MFASLQHASIDVPRPVLKTVATIRDLCETLRTKDVKPFRDAGVEDKHVHAIFRHFQVPARVDELKAIATLFDWGLSTAAVTKATKAHGAKAAHVLAANPYATCLELGLSLETAHAIATKAGCPVDVRVLGAIHYALETAAKRGDTIVDFGTVASNAGVAEDVVRTVVDGEPRGLVRVGTRHVAMLDAYEAESFVAREIKRRAGETYMDASSFKHVIDGGGVTAEQARAIDAVCAASISVVTGGPGTGKTHLIRELVAAIGPDSCVLTAPTGRCARNIKGRTVHSHAARAGTKAETAYRRPIQETSKIPEDVKLIVCDESSMLTAELLGALFRLAPKKAHVVLIGDVDQLPPVSPGSVLGDIIETRACPTAVLSTNHRSDEGITEFARWILGGGAGEMPRVPGVDLESCTTPVSRVTELAMVDGFQPLVPVNVTRIKLNRAIQAAHEVELPVVTTKSYGSIPKGTRATLVTAPNARSFLEINGGKTAVSLDRALEIVATRPHGRLETEGGTLLAPRAPVVVLKNQPNGLCNGDVGTLSSYGDTFAKITDDQGTSRTIAFRKGHAGRYLTSAHCLTVHKAQGGEFDAVAVVLGGPFWNRSLLYTAVTRAKTAVKILGSRADLIAAIRAVCPKRRTSFRMLISASA